MRIDKQAGNEGAEFTGDKIDKHQDLIRYLYNYLDKLSKNLRIA
jgi:hypothetical protein